jgi:excisionase family DNA binding protein
MPEGARRLGCSERHLYGLAYKREIPTYVIAGHRWVDEEDIDAYVERCKAAGPGFRAVGFGSGKRKPGRPKKPKPEQKRRARRRPAPGKADEKEGPNV